MRVKGPLQCFKPENQDHMDPELSYRLVPSVLCVQPQGQDVQGPGVIKG